MKICRITSVYSPDEFGGSTIFAANLTAELAQRGHQNIVISINPALGDKYEELNGVRIYRFHPFNVNTLLGIGKESIFKQAIWTALDLYSYYSYYKIRKILIREKPDVVHIHTPIDITLSAFKAVKDLDLPLVFTLHDYLLLCRRASLLHGSGESCTNRNINPLCNVYRYFTKTIVNGRVDAVTAPSQFVLDLYKSNGFFVDTKTFVLPHGVANIDSNGMIKPKLISHKDEKINFLYVGGLTRSKGVHILINAVQQIKSDRIRLHIVGDGNYKEELMRSAAPDKRIEFYGSFSSQEVQRYYNLADVVVVPSVWSEPFGRVILEAFKYGIPVICSNNGGMRELVVNGQNGFLFATANTAQLKAIITAILEDPKQLENLGRGAFQTVKKYEFTSCVDNMIDIYQEAITKNRRRA